MALPTSKLGQDVKTACVSTSVSGKGSQHPKNDSANSTAGQVAGNIFVANNSLTCE